MTTDNSNDNDDQTILDSRFGIGDAETAFAEMGLPEGRPGRSPGRWILLALLVIGGVVVMQQVSTSGTDDADKARAARKSAEETFRSALSSGDLDACRKTLQELGPKHGYQVLVPWLDAVDKSLDAMNSGRWETALAILQQVPAVPTELEPSCTALVTSWIRRSTRSLRQHRLWLEVDQTDLESVRDWLKQAPEDAPDLQAAEAVLDQLRAERRLEWTRQFEHLLSLEDWHGVEKLVESLPSGTDLVPVQTWMETLNARRRESQLLAECRTHLLAGHVLTANRLIPQVAPEGPYQKGFQALREGLVALGEEASGLRDAIDRFKAAEFKDGFALLQHHPPDNAVVAFITEHWRDIDRRYDEFRRAVDDTVADKVAQLERGRLLLERLPEDGGALRDAVAVRTGVLRDALEAHAGHLDSRLARAWESGDFRGAWDKAQQLLVIRPDDRRALETKRRLNDVAEQLVDDIYILRGRDPVLARTRFNELREIVPPSHPEHAAALELLEDR